MNLRWSFKDIAEKWRAVSKWGKSQPLAKRCKIGEPDLDDRQLANILMFTELRER